VNPLKEVAMNAAGNVIFFRRQDHEAFCDAAEKVVEKMTDQEEMNFLLRARKVLDEMEESWEEDHGRPELRDKFHLLRYYLAGLPDRAREESKSTIIVKEE
jgi:hypothetical protein